MNEKQIYFLYKKFKSLNPNENGYISNGQFLELNEFKYCPFKKLLPKALKIEIKDIDKNQIKNTDNDMKVILINKKSTIAIEENEDEDEDEDGHNVGLKEKNIDSNVIVENNRLISHESKSINFGNSIKTDVINRDTKFNKLILNENESNGNNDIVPISINEGKYINFSKFCNILRVFNKNFPVDSKIKCNFHN